MIATRWVELPDCPSCPRVWPTWAPAAIAGGVVALILIVALSILIYHYIERRADWRIERERTRQTEIEHRRTCPTCFATYPELEPVGGGCEVGGEGS